jgi:branched-chain amino acid transport system substrate-binding protein
VLAGDHVKYQPQPLRSAGVDQLSCEDEELRPRLANCGEDLCRTGVARPALDQTESGVIRCDDEIELSDQRQACPQAQTLDRGDRRLANGADPAVGSIYGLDKEVVVNGSRAGGHAYHVASSAERPPGGTNQYRPYAGIGVGLLEGIDQLLSVRSRSNAERVEAFWSIEYDVGHAGLDFVNEILPCHRSLNVHGGEAAGHSDRDVDTVTKMTGDRKLGRCVAIGETRRRGIHVEVSSVKGRALALCLGGALVFAACGSSKSSHVSSSTSAPSSSGSTAPSAASLPTPSSPASGTALKVFFFNEEGASAAASSPEDFTAAEAAVDYVNKNLGGVKGRPLSLIHCPTLGTPDSVINCANQAVSDKVDVVINGTETSGSAAVPILAGAGIPFINQNTGDPAALTNSNTFVISAGDSPLLAAPVEFAKDQGYKSFGMIYTNVTSLAAAANSVLGKLASQNGISFTAVPVAVTTADLTPAYSSLLAKKVDAIEVVTDTAQCSAALQARQSLGDSTPMFMSTPCSGVLNSVPASVDNGAYLVTADTSTAANAPDTQTFRTAMSTYEPSASTKGFAAVGFSSIMNLYSAVEKSSTPAASLDATTIKEALSTATDVHLWLAGGMTFSCGAHLFASAPSACAGAAFLLQYNANTSTFSLAKGYDMSGPLKGIL